MLQLWQLVVTIVAAAAIAAVVIVEATKTRCDIGSVLLGQRSKYPEARNSNQTGRLSTVSHVTLCNDT